MADNDTPASETTDIEETPPATTDESTETETTESEGESGESTGTEGSEEPKPVPEKKNEVPEVERVRKMFAAAKRREQAAEAKLTQARQFESKAKAHDDFAQLIKTDPLEAFRSAGFNEEDALKLIEAAAPTSAVDQLKAQLAKERRDNQIAAEKAWVERRTAEIASQIKATAGQDNDPFDLVNSREAHNDVIDLMIAYHKEHGTQLDPMIAAAHLEATMEAQMGKSKKFQRVSKAPSKDTKPTAKTGSDSAVKPTNKTLTNAGSSSVPVAEDELPLDSKERIRVLQKKFGFI